MSGGRLAFLLFAAAVAVGWLAVGEAQRGNAERPVTATLARSAQPDWAVAVRVPRVGRLEWRCASPSRFLARFHGEGVSLTLRAVVGGRTLRFHSIAGGVAQAPAQGPGEQRWSVTSRSEPSTKTVAIKVNFAVTGQAKRCYASPLRVTVHDTPHER